MTSRSKEMSTVAKKGSIFSKAFAERTADGNSEIAALRNDAFAYFEAVGFPSVRSEDWKYTNVAPIADIDWKIAKAADKASEAGEEFGKFTFRRNGFTALNQAFAEPRFIRIPKDTVAPEPIVIDLDGVDGEVSFPRTIVNAEPGSRLMIVEIYGSRSKSFTNAACQIFIGENASVTHYRIQKEAAEAFNYGVTEATLSRGSYYNATSINLGAALSRDVIVVKFAAEGATAVVDGLYLLNGTQHHDTHSIIDHMVPNCTSHQNYKGVLNDNSRAVFNGKVMVREDARGTDANQSNKNLLLSNDARVDTKPQLEIFNDDVKCAHGATVGQLEEEELFYLLTRGLPETLARNLLTYGFAEEIINKFEIESIKEELDAAVLNRLQAVI